MRNEAVRCLDRHLKARGDKTALVFGPDDPSQPAQRISYLELHAPEQPTTIDPTPQLGTPTTTPAKKPALSFTWEGLQRATA